MNAPANTESLVTALSLEKSIQGQIRVLLSGAVRAPSTHNSQPWRFHIENNLLQIHRDPSVALPNSDKEGQYAHISIGFLLHHIEVLGNFLGMSPVLRARRDGPALATVCFALSTGRDETFRSRAEAVFKRRNRRGLFKKEPFPPELRAALTIPPNMPDGLPVVPLAIIENPNALARIGELTKETMIRLYGVPSFRAEMSHWVIPSGSRRPTGIPGYSLNQPFLLSFILPSIIRRFNIGALPGKMSAQAIASAQAMVTFGSGADLAAWLAIGYESSHIILNLVSQGYDASVYVATAELPDIRAEAMRLAGLTKQLRFLFAVGKLEGDATWRTPRVPLADKIDV